MRAPLSELNYRRAPPRRRSAAGRRPAILVAAMVVLALLGYAGYRGGLATWHRFHVHETASSHKVTSAQLGALRAVTPALTEDPSFQHQRDAGGAVPAAPSPAAAVAPPASAPAGVILNVPYTVQAPFANWKFHEESCEEATLLMYRQFLQGDSRADIPPGEADQGLRALKAWQVTNWGSEVDLTLERTGQLAHDYWGYHYQVMPATEESIRQAIAAGHPVVVPVMTRSLQNPHYGPKTVYHEVLLKGYSAGGAIANDPGVQEGKNWFYSWDILFGAIDAQTAKMNQGRVALVLTT
ncbi:MAG: hypothetical protein NVSMB17_05850 [Candidatus Dormibacteria bacterium]